MRGDFSQTFAYSSQTSRRFTAGLEIYEISPRKIKQAIVGYGAAQKFAVAKMVQRLLQLPAPPAPDAADALAVALAHLQDSGRYSIGGLKKI